jgi:hypothetical protein
VFLETMTAPVPSPVVLTLDLLAGSFWDQDCYQVLELWRDGQIRPVVNRPLLIRYIKVLRGLGLSDELARRWGWWFTCPDKVTYQDVENDPSRSLADTYFDLAQAAGAKTVICRQAQNISAMDSTPSAGGISWLSASIFLQRFKFS